jgi:uncharacterized protein (DUF433 family)
MLHLKNKDLADYFDYDPATDAIRIRGHRVGIDLILDSYISGKNMEELQEEFDSLTAEELYAAITYYLLNKDELDRWLDQVHAEAGKHMADADDHPLPATLRIRQMLEEQRRNGANQVPD